MHIPRPALAAALALLVSAFAAAPAGALGTAPADEPPPPPREVAVPPTADQVLEDALVNVAQDQQAADWEDRALAGVVAELAGLEDLGALAPDDTVVALVTIVDGEVTSIEQLRDIDGANAALLAEGLEEGRQPRPAVTEVLGPLPAEALDAARAGDASLDARPWVAALHDLVVARTDDPPASTTPVATGRTAVNTGQMVASAGLAVLVVAVLGGAAAAVVLLRRRGDLDGRDHGTKVVLEASRRMTTALDADEVHRIALRAAVEMTDAEHGAWISREPGGGATWGAATAGAPLLGPTDEQGAIARALATGQATGGDAAREPWLTGAAGHVTALPVLVDGVVAGAVVVVRRRGAPSPAVQRDLGSLSPVTGSALAAACAHRGAVDASLADALTGLPNRRRLDSDLAAIGPGGRFSIAMVDVDSFKRFNDTNGHAAGDVALRLIGRALASAVRAEDTVYRYGGEEFCVVLPRARQHEVTEVAQRLCEAVRAMPVPGGEHQPGGRVTVSVGIGVRRDAEPPADVLRRADEALYAAKDGGRDRVEVSVVRT